MRYLIAVSGGVDSVVLLDQLAAAGDRELIVAHFDHGIRTDSEDDARFVSGLAQHYGLPFVSARAELGPGASEELARKHRYAFLCEAAKKYDATIVTAHHADDAIETIAINLKRGTGWRGLAVLSNSQIVRPLLHLTKAEILDYALQRRLEWVEDSTNAGDTYLRNQLRHLFARRLRIEQKEQLLDLWRQQVVLKRAIEQELAGFTGQAEHARYRFINMDEISAAEILRAVIVAQTAVSPTRPQLERAVLAIKTAKPRTAYELGAGVTLKFSQRRFIVETL